MKKILFSSALCAVALGVWSGWRAGSDARLRRAGAGWTAGPHSVAGQSQIAVLMGGPVPGSVSLQQWRDLMDQDPQGCRTGDPAWLARVRELARGLSLEDLRGRIEEGMQETLANNSTSILLGELIREFARRDAAQTCDFLFRKNYWRSDGNVFEEWGRQGPQAAFAWIEAHAQFEKNRYQIIRGWAESSPAEAFQMMVDLEENDKLDAADVDWTTPYVVDCRFTFWKTWAKNDPEAAVAACAAHSDLAFCRNAWWDDVLTELDPPKRERLIAAIRTMPDPGMRADALSSCASFFAVSGDTEKAVALTEDGLLRDHERRQMRWRVLDMWMTRADAQAGAEWYLKSSPPGQEAAALTEVVGNWSGRAESLSGPLSWLQNLPPDRLPDNAPEIFAKAGFPVDPVPGLQGWLALQPAGEVRPEALTRLGQYLSSSPQATRLPALLQEAGFPADLSARLLAATGLTGN